MAHRQHGPVLMVDEPGSGVPATVQVVFMPSGRRGHFVPGTPVLEAARRLGVDIDSVCGGRGLCGRCQVTPAIDDRSAHALRSQSGGVDIPVSPIGQNESRYRQRRSMPTGRRLSCSTRIEGNLIIDVPAQSQVHRQLVRKGVEAHDIVVRPRYRLCMVQVDEPEMHRPAGDWQRLQRALQDQWQLARLHCRPHIMSDLQSTLRRGQWQVTVALRAGPGDPSDQAGADPWSESTLVAVWPGIQQQMLGVAIDIGSTTIAAQLCDLNSGEVLASDGLMNPQIRFGEDLMSRVSWAMMNPDRWEELTSVVREAINQLLSDLAGAAAVPVSDILDLTVVANPVMHHLFLGINPAELGTAPFALATDQSVYRDAVDLGLVCSPAAQVYMLPCIAGHVGADTAGVILAERPDLAGPVSLIVDVGTNAEIILGNQHHLLACSSPTGPAFEGAQISCGQRATPGAIERVRIDPMTLEPCIKVIGCELWSDDPGFAAQVALSGVTGMCGSGIIEAVAQLYLCGLVGSDGIIGGPHSPGTTRLIADGRTMSYRVFGNGEDALLVTQGDVRAIQLAKAALSAGIKLLMQHLQVRRIDQIRLAGAFGSHIDVVQAMVIGMLPDCPVSNVSAAGNAAGTGARIALLDRESRPLIERVVQQIEKIETAIEPEFQDLFVQALHLPHSTDDYSELNRAIQMPSRRSETSVGSRLRRGQRHRERRQKAA